MLRAGIQFKLIFLLFLITLAGFYHTCAHKLPPGGGPEDKTPPEVVYHYPAKDSVNISTLDYIEIEFSEPVRKTTVQGNFWLMPELPGEIEVKWKGSRKVQFILHDSLEADQTYVFSLSTGITDLRNNKLSAPFQMAFSTGHQLDRGSIRGQVLFERRQEDVYIYAYRWNGEENPDSLLHRRPRYYTQADINGTYHQNYLSMGTYRLVALQDKDYNDIYTVETDLIGLPFMDLTLDSADYSFININFSLIDEDTTRPYISKIDTLSDREILLQMNEEVQLLDSFFSAVWDSSGRKLYQPIAVGQEIESPGNLHLYFGKVPSGQEMTLILTGIEDRSGNAVISDSLFRAFTMAVRQDTAAPGFRSMIPTMGSGKVGYDTTVQLIVNVPVDTASWKNSFSMRDSSGNVIQGRFNFTQLDGPLFKPEKVLDSNMDYSVKLKGDSLFDLWQRPFPDTVYSLSFRTVDMAELGEISGHVRVPSLNWQQALIEALPIRGRDHYRTLVKKDEEYMLNNLPDGRYLMRAILDLNNNEKWDKGGTMPWTFAEPFVLKSDTVKVRKRWTTQGIDFEFIFREQK